MESGLILFFSFIFIINVCNGEDNKVFQIDGESFLEDATDDDHVEVREMVKRDANSQLAFLSFAMALLNTIVNVISAVNNNNNNNNDNNMNVNMNEVMSMNKRRSFPTNKNSQPYLDIVFGTGTRARMVESALSWAQEKVQSNPGCIERFVCETYRTGETLSELAYVLMMLSNS